jgi:hypothetical protein
MHYVALERNVKNSENNLNNCRHNYFAQDGSVGIVTRVQAGHQRPLRETDYSSLFSAKVSSAWNCTSTPSICLHDVQRNSFTCTFYIFVTTVNSSMEHKQSYDRNYKCAFIKFHMWTCCNVADTYDAACHKRDHLLQGRTQGGGDCRAAGPPSPQNRN